MKGRLICRKTRIGHLRHLILSDLQHKSRVLEGHDHKRVQSVLHRIFQCGHSQWLIRHWRNSHFKHGKPSSHLTDSALGTPTAGEVHLWHVFICQVLNSHVIDGSQVFYFIFGFEVHGRARIKPGHGIGSLLICRAVLTEDNYGIFFTTAI